tara:strand:- start:221 stop:409 length:189 start_codon:yes stop_codon:yes gene_type:complete
MLSKQEWDELQQLSYDVMPKWWYNREQRDANYEAYVQGVIEWEEKNKENLKVLWGSPSVDME